MMILLHTKNIILAGFTLGFLAACSSTTTTGGNDNNGGEGCPDGQELNELDECVDITNGDDTRGDVTTGTGPLDVITIDDVRYGLNGLPFDILDNGNIAKGDIDGKPLTLRALKLVRTLDVETPSLSAELVDATITISKNGKWNAVVVFDDVTSPEFELTAGHDFIYDGTTYTFHINEATGNIFIVEATSTINPDFADGELDGVLFRTYTGYETDPLILLDIDAVASYVGEFDLLLASTADDGDLEIDGVIRITADFTDGQSIEGSLTELTLNGDGVDPEDAVVLDFSGSISGNGWNATIDGVSIGDGTEDGVEFGDNILVGDDGGQLDGVFYGAVGEETAGTIIVDAELTDDIDPNYDVVGGGGFVACEGLLPDCINP